MSVIGKRVIYVGPADGANHKPLNVEGIATEASMLPGSVLDYAASSAGLELMDDAATVKPNPALAVIIGTEHALAAGRRGINDGWIKRIRCQEVNARVENAVVLESPLYAPIFRVCDTSGP